MKNFARAVALISLAGGVFLGAPACVQAKGRKKPSPPPVPTGEAPVEVPVAEAGPTPGHAVVWALSAADDPLLSAEALARAPELRVTLVFPPAYFGAARAPSEIVGSGGTDDKSRRAKEIFARLISSGQVEAAMSLPGQPPLALLQDSQSARTSAVRIKTLPPPFAWPEDVQGQLAQARGLYRRQWQADPPGLALSDGLLAGPELALIEKTKVRWVLLPSTAVAPNAPVAGAFAAGALSVVRPAVPPVPAVAIPGAATPEALFKEWFNAWRQNPQPAPFQAHSLAEFARFDAAWRDAGRPPLALLSELVAGRGLPAWPAPPADFSPWIGESAENAAWSLLGETRRAVEDFKNSGNADIRTLDQVMREIYNVESGRYFYFFGADFSSGRDPDLEQEFLAGLAQVYRLMGRPVPPSLFRGLSATVVAAGDGDDDETVFQGGADSWRWMDAARDDRGPGDYFYPNGAEYVSGSWDLRVFEVRATEQQIVFSFQMGEMSNPGGAPAGFSLPLVDVYIDINHAPGAGSALLLPGRPGETAPQDAWEYALTVDGWGARLYQYAPGGGTPRLLARLPVKADGKSFETAVPRASLRGEPGSWGYGVAVMGRGPDAGDPPRPMPVRAEPGPRNFGGASTLSGLVGPGGGASTPSGLVGPGGGAAPGIEAPPFLDVLTPRGVGQSDVLNVYKSGRDVVLPFVREEQP